MRRTVVNVLVGFTVGWLITSALNPPLYQIEIISLTVVLMAAILANNILSD